MRGGTSKGIYVDASLLPSEREHRNALLLRLVGDDNTQIDGLGGGNMLTSKVAIVSRSVRPDVDVDYQFVQVIPGRGLDDGVACGNTLAGVGAFACECGMVKIEDPTTVVTIHDVNTDARIEQELHTPAGQVNYVGDSKLAGVPHPAAPVKLRFYNLARPDCLWPTGRFVDDVDGVPITLINTLIPVMIVSAQAVGMDHPATRRDMYDRQLIDKLLALRSSVATVAGMEIANKVIPKIAVVARSTTGADLRVSYFTPYTPHLSLAVSGAISIATAIVNAGTVAAEQSGKPTIQANNEIEFTLEHVAGTMNITMIFEHSHDSWYPTSANIVRTVRMLMRGTAYVPMT